MMHEWWWFNRYESVNYPLHHNRLGSQTAVLDNGEIDDHHCLIKT
jgi:hypothetical protein